MAGFHQAAIAQSVEHFIRNEKVDSSSLSCGSKDKRLIIKQITSLIITFFLLISLINAR